MPDSPASLTATPRATDPGPLWWLALAALCATLLAPLLLVDVPPLLDYPNHLARLTVLAFGRDDPNLTAFYAARWSIIPDLGIDLGGPWMLRLLPVHVAGRLIIASTLLLPVLGTIAYSRAALGRRSWWVLGCGLVAYHQTLLLGFLNFTASLGLALLLAAAWVRQRDSHPVRALVVASVGAAALFFCHLMGLLFYGLLIGAHEAAWLWTLIRTRTGPVLRRTLHRVAADLVITAVPVVLYVSSELNDMSGDAEFLSPAAKARELLVPFTNYVLSLDIATGCLVFGFALACLATRRCVVPLRAGIALALLLLLYAAAPFAYKATYNLDMRFVVMLAFLLFGGLLPRHMPRVVTVLATGTFALVFIARMSVLAFAWHAHAADVAGVRSVIATVPAGSLVYVATVSPDEAPAYWHNGPVARRLSNGERTDVHLAALLLIERRAWWPFLFDNASQQPIETREPYRSLASRVGGVQDSGVVATTDLCGFDYVLLLEAGAIPDLANYAGKRLTLVASNDMAALFGIRVPRSPQNSAEACAP